MNAPRPYTHAPLNPKPISRDALVREASTLLTGGMRLTMISCHDDGDRLRVVYSFTGDAPHQVTELVVIVPGEDPWIPSLAAVSYPAGNFEREMRDLFGLRPADHPQPYRLVRHGHWPRGWYPMRRDAGIPTFEPDTESFPFLEVEGPGVYEIAVGPVHAGIIEPGHFRFSVVGETIIRMEARQWYMHRGIEKLFEGRPPDAGIELAEAITGDSTIGHSLAYVMAVEDALQIDVPEHQRRHRALLLELERLYNHVTDLGALANDAEAGVIDSHAGRLREALLRINKDVSGHRLLRGALTIGGTALRALPDPAALRQIAEDVATLVAITLDHAIVRDRFTGTAFLPESQARTLGTLGFVARASGILGDARREHPFVDLGDAFEPVGESGGDIRARYLVRAREFAVSTGIAIDLIDRLSRPTRGVPAAEGSDADRGPRTGQGDETRAGLGIVEGWRGAICHRVELGTDGMLTRVKIVDPSFFNWPALPVALGDTIVPDFPLANKSFNQSYAGNDL
jgi:Ni,Fe-hydrogenase III large subunit/Ni,Fe-hydrogenase III component G